MRMDKDVNVLTWQSEEMIVPYISPVDNKPHRYFPDVVATVKQTDGNVKTVMIEIKPLSQITRPVVPKDKRPTKALINKIKTFAVNEAKFKAAQTLCENKGWQFIVMTEKDLGL